LRKNNNITEIQAYERKNPINTSYELLWHELTRPNLSGITTQNIMRRIIESYFKLVGKYGDDVLINKFPTAQEREICRSLICWINDGSHGVTDDLFVEQIGVTAEKYQEVFKNIFKYMNHEEHYTMMTIHLAKRSNPEAVPA
jgi:wobble nucleotide-excising tRNase